MKNADRLAGDLVGCANDISFDVKRHIILPTLQS